LFICAKLSLEFCHISAYGSTCTTVGLVWPEGSTSLWGREFGDASWEEDRLPRHPTQGHHQRMAPGMVYYGESREFPPPRSGRQPDVRTASWTESPIDLQVAEAGALLAEVGLLKERGLTAEVVVADFIFKNIQPLKDRAYPTYLYRGLANSTRVTNRRIFCCGFGQPARDDTQRQGVEHRCSCCILSLESASFQGFYQFCVKSSCWY
jgi:hypothetical protein